MSRTRIKSNFVRPTGEGTRARTRARRQAQRRKTGERRARGQPRCAPTATGMGDAAPSLHEYSTGWQRTRNRTARRLRRCGLPNAVSWASARSRRRRDTKTWKGIVAGRVGCFVGDREDRVGSIELGNSGGDVAGWKLTAMNTIDPRSGRCRCAPRLAELATALI